MKSFAVKMGSRLAERLLRKPYTNYLNSKGECSETLYETHYHGSMVAKLDVAEIYYKGHYWKVARKDNR